jgi:hypothetical protein
MTWEATMFVVPAVTEEQLSVAVRELRAYATDCEIEPCMRVVVSPIDDVF